MSKPFNILISGSGIASSVFSHWLLRAYPKANIDIVERAPALRLTGASVDIRSSAVDIIKWMDAEQEIRSNHTKEEGIQWVHSNGKPIATIRATCRTDIQSITSEFEIFRGKLAKIFMDPVEKRVKLIFDDYVDSFEQRDEEVIVTFVKSKKTKTYDLLVAANGLSSKIRGMMLNTKPSEQIYDEGVHVCYFTVKKDMLGGHKLAKWYTATGGRNMFIRPAPYPEGRTSCLVMIVRTMGDTQTKNRLDTAIREGHESCKKLMEEMFHDAGWVAPEVLQSMRESDDFYCSLFGQVRSPKIHEGRVVLLGDAAYATPGIGTSLAIIGGYVLAGELLNHPDDVGTALKRYEELLLPFSKGQQGGAGAMQLLNPQTQWGIGIRNTILGFVTRAKLDKLTMYVAGWLGFTEKKLKMPDYPWLVDEHWSSIRSTM